MFEGFAQLHSADLPRGLCVSRGNNAFANPAAQRRAARVHCPRDFPAPYSSQSQIQCELRRSALLNRMYKRNRLTVETRRWERFTIQKCDGPKWFRAM